MHKRLKIFAEAAHLVRKCVSIALLHNQQLVNTVDRLSVQKKSNPHLADRAPDSFIGWW